MSITTVHATPFAIVGPVSVRLGAVYDHWRSLFRGEAAIPFADDVKPDHLQRFCPDVLVLHVFEKPLRFRLDLARTPNAPEVEAQMRGKFLDEISPSPPLEFILAQASAAVESLGATIYAHRPRHGGRAYDRLLLPAWSEGHVSLLIGALEFR